jgi:hypothetical protein
MDANGASPEITQMTKFAEMGKTELRAACKAASISYGKLTVAEMRAALQDKVLPGFSDFAAKKLAEAAAQQPAEKDLRKKDTRTDEDYVELASKMDITQLGDDGIEGHCPCCGVHLSNGCAHYADMVDSAGTKEANKMKNEWTCLGCGGEWGAALNHVVTPRAAPKGGSGVKIEKNREQRNGIKRPSAGGKCRLVWDALDILASKNMATLKDIKAVAEASGWNPNNATIEFYNWRKFNA